jgi:Domain of unknown function (DUF4412)
MRLLIRSLAVIVLAVGVPALAQDLTIVSKVTSDGKPAETTTSYLSRDHVRMAQGERQESIVDFKTGQMTTLDGRKKTYYVITRQDVEKMAARMKEQMNSPEMKKSQEKMKNLSREDQKKMDAAMGGMFAFDVQKTGATRRIAGYTCENWKITIGEFSRTEECLTSELQFPVQAWDMYKGFAESMKSMMAAFGPMAKSVENMQEKFKSMKGYPLATTTAINVMGHSTTSVSEVTEVKRGLIPASAWEIPAGYTKVDNPILKGFDRSGRSSRRDD